jgi:hypothetical protein
MSTQCGSISAIIAFDLLPSQPTLADGAYDFFMNFFNLFKMPFAAWALIALTQEPGS